MVVLTINDQRIEVDEGTTILKAARESGIEISTLCYHPALEPYQACRVCVVEVDQNGKSELAASCGRVVEEGMIVKTDSERARRARKVTVELLLARAPGSEIIQDLASKMDIKASRFKTKDEKEKCVLCGLCVRICNDVMKVGAIGFANRGANMEIAPPFKKSSKVCTTCGACAFICPTGAIVLEDITDYEVTPIASEFDVGLSSRPCIYTPFPQAVPNKPILDSENCMYFKTGNCKVCENVCGPEAIDYNQEDKELEIEAGSIIVATGFDLLDPSEIERLGFGRYPAVHTSLEFERLNNASGPTDGKILTRDGKVPQSVAIVHCVGSRDQNYKEYCSKVCCMYSLKFAHLIRDKTGADVYNFYIDMRSGGKRYEEFYKRLSDEGVRFVRGKVVEVTDKPLSPDEKEKLIVVAEDTLIGQVVRIPADMVILSPAMKARQDAQEVARTFGLARDASGFFLEKHPKMAPVATATDGIFIAGTCSGPMDIPESVAQGQAAAASALSLAARGKVQVESATAQVIEELCSGCQMCVELCEYSAIEFDEKNKVSRVNEVICKGCGTCVAACTSGAILGKHYTKEQIMAEIDGVLS